MTTAITAETISPAFFKTKTSARKSTTRNAASEFGWEAVCFLLLRWASRPEQRIQCCRRRLAHACIRHERFAIGDVFGPAGLRETNAVFHVDDGHDGARPVGHVRAGVMKSPSVVKAYVTERKGAIVLLEVLSAQSSLSFAVAFIADLEVAAELEAMAARSKSERAHVGGRRLQRNPSRTGVGRG